MTDIRVIRRLIQTYDRAILRVQRGSNKRKVDVEASRIVSFKSATRARQRTGAKGEWCEDLSVC